jgi:hypothetical protein
MPQHAAVGQHDAHKSSGAAECACKDWCILL